MLKEVLTERTEESCLQTNGSRVVSVRRKDITKKGARVFKEGKIFSSSYVGDVSNDVLLRNALGNKYSAISYEYNYPKVESCSKDYSSSEKNITGKYQKLFIDSLAKLEGSFSNFTFQGISLHNKLTRTLINSENVCHEITSDSFDWAIKFENNKSLDLGSGVLWGEACKFHGFDEINHFMKRLMVHNNILKVEEKSLPVIFLNQNEIIIEICKSFRVDNYKNGTGLFKNCLGDKIFSDKVSLVDSLLWPERGAMKLFDGDGLVRNDSHLELINKGVFENVISDSSNAVKYNVEATGNGVRKFDSAVRLGFNKVLLKDGLRNPQEILKRIDKCIIVTNTLGYGFSINGDYSASVECAYMMEYGEYTGRLPSITLKSNLQRMLNDDLIDITKGSLASDRFNPSIIMEMTVVKN